MGGSIWGRSKEGHNEKQACRDKLESSCGGPQKPQMGTLLQGLWLELGIQNVNSSTVFPYRPLCFIFGRKLLTLWQPSMRASKVINHMNSLH